MALPRNQVSKSEIVSALPWVLGAVFITAVISFIWWGLLDPAKEGGIERLVIPEGTAAKIDAGEPTFAIPSDIIIVRAGQVTIVNEDVTSHLVAGRVVAAGETMSLSLGSREGEFDASFHVSGYVNYTVAGRGGLLITVAVPTLIFGLPIGLGLALAIAVARRIGFSYETPG